MTVEYAPLPGIFDNSGAAASAQAASQQRFKYHNGTITASGGYSMSSWDSTHYDASSNSINQALPASGAASIGDEVELYLDAVTGTNTLTGTFNGSTVMTLKVAGHKMPMRYNGTTWLRTEEKSLASEDALYKMFYYLGDPRYDLKLDGTTDDSTVLNALIAAAPLSSTFIMPANKTCAVGTTIALGGAKRLIGGDQNSGCVIKALTSGMTILTVDASSVVEDIQLNGNFLAGYGIKTTPQANKLSYHRVRVVQCNDAGFVFEGTQNSLILDCYAQYNGINYALYNGAANCKFISCNSNNQDTNPPATSATRGIVIANSADSRLTGTIYAGGNRGISFIGGVMERGNPIDYQVQISNLGGYISFTEVEFDNGIIANIGVDSTAGTNNIYFNRCDFHLTGDPNKAISAASGAIHLAGCNYVGTSGRDELGMITLSGTATMDRALTSATEPPNILGMANSFFQTSIGTWTTKSTGTVTWDSTFHRLDVTSSGPGNGGECFLPGTYPGFLVSGRMARVRFAIRNLTGATAVNFAFTNNSGVKTAIGAFPEGVHDVLVELDGDEGGIFFGASTSVSSTFQLCYVTVALF